eukprot:scaffold28528_cov24-Tisochrysis_lutea.AAC.2
MECMRRHHSGIRPSPRRGCAAAFQNEVVREMSSERRLKAVPQHTVEKLSVLDCKNILLAMKMLASATIRIIPHQDQRVCT